MEHTSTPEPESGEAIIVRFIGLANTIELAVNLALEHVLFNAAQNIAGLNAVEDTVDHLEEQSIRTRLNIVILFLSTRQVSNTAQIINELKAFASYCNKYISQMRDFVAHNPFMNAQADFAFTPVITSSRRFTGKLNSVTIEEVKAN